MIKQMSSWLSLELGRTYRHGKNLKISNAKCLAYKLFSGQVTVMMTSSMKLFVKPASLTEFKSFSKSRTWDIKSVLHFVSGLQIVQGHFIVKVTSFVK